MQSLYAFIQKDDNDLAKGEKEMMNSIEQVYDLYIYLLDLFVEIKDVELRILEERKNKHLPTETDLNPNRRFIDNQIFKLLESNKQLQLEKAKRKISWTEDRDIARKILNQLKAGNTYAEYMLTKEGDFETDRKFIVKFFKKYIADNDLIRDYFEELDIHWVDDIYFACGSVVKTLKAFEENSNESLRLLELFKDYEDDRKFLVTMFRQTVMNNEELNKVVESKAKNWETDRIAAMDMLLMKMAITELTHVSSIPVKVTLNEYIELAKTYSTPKSKVFINGILDKLLLELKDSGDIQKTGRGLKE